MEQMVYPGKIHDKEEQIAFVKKWLDELYRSEVFFSFSLYTLELSRRFKSSYSTYFKTGNHSELEQLFKLSENLEKRLLQEGEL
ncbi:hypothetical protein [Salinimicrobium flavum]|uniref:Uncharacterized protein n=1 Tax=Salinimicrobium flavum TaxID=1737065 RepID=A0ABW5J058_9FLAO